MREGVIQLNTSGTTGYSFGKNILDLNLISYTRIHSSGSKIYSSGSKVKI